MLVIGKVCRRGSNVRRLLGYLLLTEGLAGEHELKSEHRDAHVIAGDDAGLAAEACRVPVW